MSRTSKSLGTSAIDYVYTMSDVYCSKRTDLFYNWLVRYIKIINILPIARYIARGNILNNVANTNSFIYIYSKIKCIAIIYCKKLLCSRRSFPSLVRPIAISLFSMSPITIILCFKIFLYKPVDLKYNLVFYHPNLYIAI